MPAAMATAASRPQRAAAGREPAARGRRDEFHVGTRSEGQEGITRPKARVVAAWCRGDARSLGDPAARCVEVRAGVHEVVDGGGHAS